MSRDDETHDHHRGGNDRPAQPPSLNVGAIPVPEQHHPEADQDEARQVDNCGERRARGRVQSADMERVCPRILDERRQRRAGQHRDGHEDQQPQGADRGDRPRDGRGISAIGEAREHVVDSHDPQPEEELAPEVQRPGEPHARQRAPFAQGQRHQVQAADREQSVPDRMFGQQDDGDHAYRIELKRQDRRRRRPLSADRTDGWGED